MNVARLLKRFRSRSTPKLTVKRATGGSIRNGVVVADGFETFEIEASVQPMNFNDTNFDIANVAEVQWYKIYSAEKLFVIDDRKGQVADIVMIDGRPHEVKDTQDYTHLRNPHYKSVAVLLTGTNDDDV